MHAHKHAPPQRDQHEDEEDEEHHCGGGGGGGVPNHVSRPPQPASQRTAPQCSRRALRVPLRRQNSANTGEAVQGGRGARGRRGTHTASRLEPVERVVGATACSRRTRSLKHARQQAWGRGRNKRTQLRRGSSCRAQQLLQGRNKTVTRVHVTKWCRNRKRILLRTSRDRPQTNEEKRGDKVAFWLAMAGL